MWTRASAGQQCLQGLTAFTLSRQLTTQLLKRNLRLQLFFQLGIDFIDALQAALQHRQHFLFQ
jgi:hypothetical protein